jgi:hypothetical protein
MNHERDSKIKMDQSAMGETMLDQRSRSSRRNPRRQIEILAALLTDEKKVLGFATVANMSAGGAMIVFGDQFSVPDHFVLALSKSGPFRNCLVVWRKDNSVGVRFLPTSATN